MLKMPSSKNVPADLTHGRTNQKLRTKNALLEAARALIANGETPTVEAAAAAAAISRTTAYRYFRTQAELLAAAHPETVSPTLLPKNPPDDPSERLAIVVSQIISMVIGAESRYRTMLRLSLEEGPHREPLLLRQGRAIPWIEEALAPIRSTVSRSAFKRLVLAVRAAIGIEALVWLTDIAGLSRDEARENMAWAAQSLLAATIAEESGAKQRTNGRKRQ